MNDETSRPALAATVENMEQYDTVVLAFPIWWGQAPRLIETFVEAHDLSGKTVITFCTSASSGYGRTGEILAALTDETVHWIEGARFPASTTAETCRHGLRKRGSPPIRRSNPSLEMNERRQNHVCQANRGARRAGNLCPEICRAQR